MNILLVNDDGVYAPGILNLFHHLKNEHRVVILAPQTERSATGHTMTLDHPLRLAIVDQDIYSLSGFPADCTLLGLTHLQKDLDIKFDLVISGINRGANLGQDIFYSGTVAAAREASFRGVKSIAVSSCMDFHSSKNNENYYDSASILIKKILQLDVHTLIPDFSVMNVNVPWCSVNEINGAKLCKLGFRNYSEEVLLRQDFRGRDYFWIGGAYLGHQNQEGTDCQAIDEKYASISILKLLDQCSDNISADFSNKNKLDEIIQELF